MVKDNIKNMQTRNVVVHRNLVAVSWKCATEPTPMTERAKSVDKIIQNLLNEEPEAIDWAGDPEKIAELFNPGDRVTLYGGIRGACLRKAYDSLVNKCVLVDYSTDGCF